MKKLLLIMISSVFLFSGCTVSNSPTTAFTIGSSDLTSGAEIADTYVYNTCGGDDESPQLFWNSVPSSALSLAITVLDLDASNFVHWIVYNLNKDTASIVRDSAVPSGAAYGPNEYPGNAEVYGGPCPPTGETHTYQFKVWALDIADLTTDATINFSDYDSIVAGIEDHEVDSAALERDYTGP